MAEDRFFLDQDEDSHWFLIPCQHREDWSDWKNLPEHDLNRWEIPQWAKFMDGPPSQITFVDPRV